LLQYVVLVCAYTVYFKSSAGRVGTIKVGVFKSAVVNGKVMQTEKQNGEQIN